MAFSLVDIIYAERVSVPGVITGQDVVNLVLAETRPRLASYDIVGQDGNANSVNAVLAGNELREDSEWSDGTVTGTFDHVEISAMATYTYDTGNATTNTLSRISPVLALLKNGTLVAVSASAYQRHSTGHNDSSNTIHWIDPAPVSGDTYTLQFRRGSTRTNVLNITQGHFTLKAVF